MWSILTSDYVKIKNKNKKVGSYGKLDMNFCTNWYKCLKFWQVLLITFGKMA